MALVWEVLHVLCPDQNFLGILGGRKASLGTPGNGGNSEGVLHLSREVPAAGRQTGGKEEVSQN